MNSVCGAINDKVVVVPGDTLHYKFPVEASLGWHFEDSASPSLFKVTHNRTRLELKEQGKIRWPAVCNYHVSHLNRSI